VAIKVRKAKISDIPQLIDKMCEHVEVQKKLGVKTIAHDPMVVRGGISIELGGCFLMPNYRIILADKEGDIVGYVIGVLEHCPPIDEYVKAVRIRADYVSEKSLAAPRILEAMWNEIYKWGKSEGAGYFYGLIHPGNQPSIRTAKHAGFKHHMTQFLVLTTDLDSKDKKEVVENE
jgi:hypothetical protein